MFFGCRNKEADFFFEDDWGLNGNVELVTAFSRDQEDKVYVQHRMAEKQEVLCKYILEMKGWFFIAGNSKSMPSQVREALVSALATQLGDTSGQEMAEQVVERMEAEGRYQTETWA